MRRQETWCRSAADALFHHSVTVSRHGAKPHVAKCNFPTHAVDEAFVDNGAVMEGTYGAFGGGMVPRRARPIPSYLALEPFNPEHMSVPAHRQPGYPVRTVESDNTPPLEDPFLRRSGEWHTHLRFELTYVSCRRMY